MCTRVQNRQSCRTEILAVLTVVEAPTGTATTVETEADITAVVAMAEVEAMAAVAAGAMEAGTPSSKFYLQLLCQARET